MRLQNLASTCIFAIAALTHTSTGAALDFSRQCSSGTMLEPYSGVCAPINDRTREARQHSSRLEMDVPDLARLRRNKLAKSAASVQTDGVQSIPPPSGIGAGTVYRANALQVLEHAELHTKMYVHPDGLHVSAPGMSWLFTAATNRSQQGVEVVGIYYETNADGSLGIFDWSCSPEYPCMNDSLGASWVMTAPLTSYTCNLVNFVDSEGHRQTIVHYVNQTRKIDNESTPMWRNAVFLWNSCEEGWDTIYEHYYRTNQLDCSQGANICGWWGPIIETFSDNLPEIDELGYEDSMLLHDGNWSELRDDETDFWWDSTVPWELFHLDPNRGFGAGNNTVLDITIDIKPHDNGNSISLRGKNGLWVAAMSDVSFDPLQIDISTVRLGLGQAEVMKSRVKDIDRDGFSDLLMYFNKSDTAIECGAETVTVNAETYTGQGVAGTDRIRTVGCKW